MQNRVEKEEEREREWAQSVNEGVFSIQNDSNFGERANEGEIDRLTI